MFRKFIGRSVRLAVKTLANGAARIYMQNTHALVGAGFVAGSKINIQYRKNSISISLDPRGSNTVFDTGRGELVELKNKDTAQSVNGASHVTVTYRVGRIEITIHRFLSNMREREQRLLHALKHGHNLRTASFFSGLGMLSYHLKQGLKQAGIGASIAFANDYDELAMSLNVDFNPMWQDATEDAIVVADDLFELPIDSLPQVDVVEIGYPCVGFSSLADVANRDTQHPLCGSLFIPLVAAVRAMQPAVILMENVKGFKGSDTLRLLKNAFRDYHFTEMLLDGKMFGELESRKRLCVIGISSGLHAFAFPALPAVTEAPQLREFLEPMPVDHSAWKTMLHVRKKDLETNHCYRNCLYTGEERTMIALTASYAHPKAGSPMIAHPTDPSLQRQITVAEHGKIRAIPEPLMSAVMTVVNGQHPLVSAKGSKTAGHRLLGNGVSPKMWNWVGESLGQWLLELRTTPEFAA